MNNINLITRKAIIFKIFFSLFFAGYLFVGILKFNEIYHDFRIHGTIFELIIMITWTLLLFSLAYIGNYQFVFLKIADSQLYIYQMLSWRKVNLSEVTKVEIRGSVVNIYIPKINIFNYVRAPCGSMDKCQSICNFIEESRKELKSH